ncbi:MAG: DUF2017 family protein [Actinomycetota bacterium]
MAAAGPFARRRKGGVDVTLTEPEIAVLRSVVEQMEIVLVAPEEIPHARRLFPPAYEDDDEAQAEFARLTTADLADGKRRALASVKATLERGVTKKDAWRASLSPEEAEDWLAVLNDTRLTLGTRLEVTEQTYDKEIDPADPDAAASEIFRYLGYVEDWLVETLMG